LRNPQETAISTEGTAVKKSYLNHLTSFQENKRKREPKPIVGWNRGTKKLLWACSMSTEL